MRTKSTCSQELLENIKKELPNLEELLSRVCSHWVYEDMVYRFYHYSFKVYRVQETTIKIVETLRKLAPEGVSMNKFFEEIFKKGTEKKFRISHNKNWMRHTEPQLSAFFHAKYFLEMAVKYGKELDMSPDCLPSGWAGLLYFYNLR